MNNLFNPKNWIQSGLIWGTIMFVLTTFLFPYFDGEPIIMKNIGVGLVIWTIAGLGFGHTLKKIATR